MVEKFNLLTGRRVSRPYRLGQVLRVRSHPLGVAELQEKRVFFDYLTPERWDARVKRNAA